MPPLQMSGSSYNQSADAKVQSGVASAGSIVDRAGTILDEHEGRKTSTATRGQSLGELPLLSDFERSTRDIREQAQDLVNAFVDLIERLPYVLQPQHMPSRGAAAPATLRLDDGELPLLRQASAAAGRLATTALGLVNQTDNPALVVLRATNLVDDTGQEIPSAFVNFSPISLTLAPRTESPVTVTVQVPSDARPGIYRGLIRAAGLEGAQAAITVNVEPRV